MSNPSQLSELINLARITNARAATFRVEMVSSDVVCECGASVPSDKALGGVCDACRAKAKPEQCEAETRAQLPAEFQWVSFDSPLLPKRVKDAEGIAAAARRNLSREWVYLTGPTRAGKTTLAWALMIRESRKLRKVGRYVDARTLAKARRESPLGATPELIAIARRAPILLLDELGAIGSEMSDDVIETIAERRLNNLPTIITSPHAQGRMAELYDVGTARRVVDRVALVALTIPLPQEKQR